MPTNEQIHLVAKKMRRILDDSNFVKKVAQVMQKIISLKELYLKIVEIVELQQILNSLTIIEILL